MPPRVQHSGSKEISHHLLFLCEPGPCPPQILSSGHVSPPHPCKRSKTRPPVSALVLLASGAFIALAASAASCCRAPGALNVAEGRPLVGAASAVLGPAWPERHLRWATQSRWPWLQLLCCAGEDEASCDRLVPVPDAQTGESSRARYSRHGLTGKCINEGSAVPKHLLIYEQDT